MVFSKHIKNKEDRGWILGNMDEMMQILEDNMVTLQGISGSRYIGPFYKGKIYFVKSPT